MMINLEDLKAKIIAKHGLTQTYDSVFYRDSNKTMRLTMSYGVLIYWGPNLPNGSYITVEFRAGNPTVYINHDSRDIFLKEVVEPFVFKREIAKLIATGDES
jgi:hypothetical protein